MGQLEVLAGSMLQTGLLSGSDEPVTLVDDIIDALTASFAALHVSDAPAADEYPSEILDFSSSPLSLAGNAPAGAMDLCVEVFVTYTGASSSSSAARKTAATKAAAERAGSPNPLRAMMQSLRVPIGTDIDASNVVEAWTRLEEDHQRLLDLTETLAAT